MAHGRYRAAAQARTILLQQEEAAKRERQYAEQRAQEERTYAEQRQREEREYAERKAAEERARRLEQSRPMREYEEARMARGKLALGGKYNVAEDPQFQMTRAGLQRLQGQTTRDIEEQGAKGLGGFSASYLAEKLKETGAGTILNLAAALQGRQGELVEEGSVAGGRIAEYLSPEWAGEMGERQQITGLAGAGLGQITGETGETSRTIFGAGAAERARLGQAEVGMHESAYQRAHEKKMGTMQTVSNICCYIFYVGKAPLYYIRQYKDSHYEPDSNVAIGYKKLASWLVPLMRESKTVMWLTRTLMLNPMVAYAEAFYTKKYFKKAALRPLTLFWLAVYITTGYFFKHSVTWTDYLELSKETL